MTNQREAELKANRPARVPLGARNKLTVEGLTDTKQFVYRWVNDVNEKPAACKAAGWEFVDKTGKIVGDVDVETGKGVSTVLVKGVGQGVKAYLMKVPRDLWEFDRKNRVEIPTNELEQGMQSDLAHKSKGLGIGSVKVTSNMTGRPDTDAE